jgi:hypothetical protein
MKFSPATYVYREKMASNPECRIAYTWWPKIFSIGLSYGNSSWKYTICDVLDYRKTQWFVNITMVMGDPESSPRGEKIVFELYTPVPSSRFPSCRRVFNTAGSPRPADGGSGAPRSSRRHQRVRHLWRLVLALPGAGGALSWDGRIESIDFWKPHISPSMDTVYSI